LRIAARWALDAIPRKAQKVLSGREVKLGDKDLALAHHVAPELHAGYTHARRCAARAYMAKVYK
jgi:hypothetical protein